MPREPGQRSSGRSTLAAGLSKDATDSQRNDPEPPRDERSIQAGKWHNSQGHKGGLRSHERARRVPDEVVDRGLSRPLPDSTAGIATCLVARKPDRLGDLTRKRSDPGMVR
jgi:hypothetical protein